MPMFKYASILNKSLFDELCEPVIVFGPDRKLVFLNYAAKKMFGKKVDKTAGVSCARLFGCAPAENAANCPFKLFSSPLVKKAGFKIPAGSSPFIEKEFAGTAFPVYDGNKTPHGAAFVVKNFRAKSEIDYFRKRADEDLKASEERYRTVADFTYDWEYWTSPEGEMIYVSPSCERISCHSPEEFIKDPGLFYNIMHADDRRKTIQYMEKVSKRSGISEIVFRIIRPDKEVRWVHHISQPVFGAGGKSLGRRASNRDITERKMMEDEILESEERYRTVADFTYDWEYWISPEGGMRYVSPSCERISGYASDKFIGDPDLFEKIIHPTDRKRAVSLIREASETSAVCETDFRIIRSDGDIRWIHHISQPVYSKNGNYLGRRASNRDITSRKKTDRELEESRKKLIEQNLELERKNIALKEVLGRIELEKKEVQDNVMLNVENVLLPILNDLASASNGREKNNIELIKKNIGDLTSAFGSRISVKSLKLTPKEIRICNMIKNGMNSKEISEMLKISVRTAETHRNNIRKKLGIARAGVNLVTYLQNYFSL